MPQGHLQNILAFCPLFWAVFGSRAQPHPSPPTQTPAQGIMSIREIEETMGKMIFIPAMMCMIISALIMSIPEIQETMGKMITIPAMMCITISALIMFLQILLRLTPTIIYAAIKLSMIVLRLSYAAIKSDYNSRRQRQRGVQRNRRPYQPPLTRGEEQNLFRRVLDQIGQELATKKYMRQNTKQCPSCKSIVVKIESPPSNNHLRCGSSEHLCVRMLILDRRKSSL